MLPALYRRPRACLFPLDEFGQFLGNVVQQAPGAGVCRRDLGPAVERWADDQVVTDRLRANHHYVSARGFLESDRFVDVVTLERRARVLQRSHRDRV